MYAGQIVEEGSVQQILKSMPYTAAIQCIPVLGRLRLVNHLALFQVLSHRLLAALRAAVCRSMQPC